MFTIKVKSKGFIRKWWLPINWRGICGNNEKITNHLSIINKINKFKYGPFIKEEVDLVNIRYMFECWLGLKEEPSSVWRLVTAGEILKDYMDKKIDPINYFRINK